MILILTDEFDRHADVVISKLDERNVKYYRLNLNVEALKYTFFTFKNNKWKITSRTGEINQNDITCVWCRRPFVELTLEENYKQDNDFIIWKNEWNQTLLGFYNSIKKLPWLNPLRKAYKGENKYYQMELARECGFIIPETLVSNSKDELIRFTKEYNGAIMKLMTQEMYIVDNEFKGFYTNIINTDSLSSFNEIEENPLILQKYIEKKYEVRYTVVGKRHFVCKIDSQKSLKAMYDWRRYDIPHTPHYPIEPPLDIQKRVMIFMDKLGIEFGALDFIVDKNDVWHFLEINCFGQWLWIEQLTNLYISDGIVDWLMNHADKD